MTLVVVIIVLGCVVIAALASGTLITLARLGHDAQEVEVELKHKAELQALAAEIDEVRQEVRDVRSGLTLGRNR